MLGSRYSHVFTWVLVSEPGFFAGFGAFPWKYNSFTGNKAQEQHSLLDTCTMFDDVFYFGPQEHIYT